LLEILKGQLSLVGAVDCSHLNNKTCEGLEYNNNIEIHQFVLSDKYYRKCFKNLFYSVKHSYYLSFKEYLKFFNRLYDITWFGVVYA